MGDALELPSTVIAKMNDKKTKEVMVTWNPNTIDTLTEGEKIAIGTVEGYEGSVQFKVYVVKGETAQISLYKDSVSPDNKMDFTNIADFHLKSVATGKVYSTGKIPSQTTRKNQFLMEKLPEGEYTIHFEMQEGMYIHKIQLGEAYKETIYDPENNRLVVKKTASNSSNYVDILLKMDRTIEEIKPLEALTVPAGISYEDFLNTLPKQTVIKDSQGSEHTVDVKWDVRPFQFQSYKKPGQVTLFSEFFKLPLNVSNSTPAKRLEVQLIVNFIE